MNALGPVLSFGAGTFCLGAACILGLIAAMVGRDRFDGEGMGCSHLIPVLLLLALALYFFAQAIVSAAAQ